MTYRGRPRGEQCTDLLPGSFIAFLQNHDQVGNRAFGERIGVLAPTDTVRAATAVYLLLPQTPMIFMGEEWYASTPFPFFCDFGPDLADAVRKGRREEFSKFPDFRTLSKEREFPIRRPSQPSHRRSSPGTSCWSPIKRNGLNGSGACWQLGRSIEPIREYIEHCGTFQVLGPGCVTVQWELPGSARLVLAANLSNTPGAGFPPVSSPIWIEGAAGDGGRLLDRWTVVWSLQEGQE